MKGYVAVLIVLIASLTVMVGADDVSARDPDYHALYPDADYIIVENSRGKMEMYSASTTDGWDKPTKEYMDSRSYIIRWSDIEDEVNIVMISGTFGSLSVVNVDSRVNPEEPVDVMFTMLSGSISTLQGVTVSTSVDRSSYYSAYCPIDNLTMNIYGNIGEFRTTSDLIEIQELDITLYEDCSVNRFYPTGSDGRYGNVHVTVAGAQIGYVSNRCAVVNYLDYDLAGGSIDYLCLGADTEGQYDSYSSSDLWTFYVMYDVEIDISIKMEIGKAIMGAGLESAPNRLCNGETPGTRIGRNVNINASGHDIAADTCFVMKDDRVYKLSDYRLGSNPRTGTLGYNYGENRTWDTHTGMTVPGGTVLYMRADLTIAKEAVLKVDPGARLINTGNIIVLGSLLAEGKVINGGIIERQSGGTVEGDLSGDGYVAYCIFARPNEGRVDLMSVDDKAVVMRSTGDEMYFNTASVRFNSIGSMISISAPEGTFIGGTEFVMAIDDRESGDNLWSLYLSGFDDYSSLTIEVTVAADIPQGYEGFVTDSDGRPMKMVGSTHESTTFIADGNGQYLVSIVENGEVPDFIDKSNVVINTIIAIAIVIVASMAVYYLLKRD